MPPPTRPAVELSGAWRLHPAEADLAKEFARPGFDDSAWPEHDVPGHWRCVPGLDTHDGPVLYRRTFATAPAPEGGRRFLELDGVFYYGDVWLDGEYVGATEGYFAPHAFEVTDALGAGGEHVLAVEVACPPQRDRTAKRTLTGTFGHGLTLDPDWNPGGLWRPVRVGETGPVRFARVRVLCTEAAVERGRLLADLTLDAAAASTDAVLAVRVTTDAGDLLASDHRDLTLAAGRNELAWTIAVAEPPRWWPHALGAQPRCHVALEVTVGGESSDSCAVVTGFREVRLEQGIVHLNGERLFLKGTNIGPTLAALATAPPELVRGDVQRAREAHLDLVRVHAHVARPELYDAADELGMLVWQDFPLQWGYARGVRREAVRQARAMVDLLGHHPSVVRWCAHNEPFAAREPVAERWSALDATRMAATMTLPTWNKNVLDRSVARAIRRADPTRPVLASSGTAPVAPGRDAHLGFGWAHGDLAGLAPAARALPRLVQFVSELGAQAVPTTDAWMAPQRWPALDWERLRVHHALQAERFERFVPPADCKTFDEWRDATQAYQAALLQLQVEDLRRLKYAPAAGFAQFLLADAHPAVSWSVLDHERVAKRGYDALRRACRPVLPMVEPRAGFVHVVSDLREPLPGARVTVTVDERSSAFTGDVAADAVTYVGRVDLTGAVDVGARLEHPAIGTVEHRYPLLVVEAGRGGVAGATFDAGRSGGPE
jgi:beta-mannosidase